MCVCCAGQSKLKQDMGIQLCKALYEMERDSN